MEVIQHITPALEFRGVGKRFGRACALDGVDLRVARGEIFGLLGRNGAGKTTLIKCLLDFCHADTGTIDILGVASRLTASRAELAFLPERFNPPHYLTGRDFLRYMSDLNRAVYDESLALDVIARLDLAPAALDKAARTYSKGMTQKLGLAACLMSGKSLYVLDEPTSGLDPKARALLKRELRALRGAGKTVFLTSHALADVQQICDRMAVLHAGRIHFSGAPSDLKTKYGADDLEEAFLECIDSALAA